MLLVSIPLPLHGGGNGGGWHGRETNGRGGGLGTGLRQALLVVPTNVFFRIFVGGGGTLTVVFGEGAFGVDFDFHP